jgi:hypothetical protein
MKINDFIKETDRETLVTMEQRDNLFSSWNQHHSDSDNNLMHVEDFLNMQKMYTIALSYEYLYATQDHE